MTSKRTTRDVAVPDGVVQAVRAYRWDGVVLPRTKISDFTVYPVITVDQHVWAERVTSANGPELDRSTLLLWESWSVDLGEEPPRSPVSIVGFVSTATKPWDAMHALDSLAGYGGAMWLSQRRRSPARWTLAEFDVAGIGVVREHDGAVDMLVQGRHGPVGTARRMVSTRHKEELLFGWALATGHSPEVAASPIPTP